MFQPSSDAKEIFLAAIECPTPEALQKFLAEACDENAALLRRVQDLLRAYEQAGNFLGGSASFEATTNMRSATELPAKQIGPYKLLQQIGEGGMGIVYMAEQTEPIQRKVALKLVKSGFESREAAARFEAERQALALMDHQNIAKVLDAGATDSSQPYFVMELVHGLPITRYCDQHRLSPRQRLELFIPVCHAVQHAHQKGIIHRDLKPSNVLIALYDGQPVPKLIDFGVARALGQKLTDKTMFTEFGAIVGTLEYMSPEQAEKSHLDVDTRSDIYSLGVLLYELLTGTTPLDRQRMKSVAVLELLRILKEEEPQKPSTRLSTVDTLASIAANRSLEPRKLSGVVRGELDWIVMKALEKDRNRRYVTANGFAADIERFLANEPVAACPPSALYRFRKYTRRHQVTFLATAIVLIALLLGTAISTWQAIRAVRAGVLAETRLERETSERARATLAEHRERDARLLAERRLYDARLAQARAGRGSGLPGQRFESWQILNEATQLARNLNLGEAARSELRNEAIACLGLTDFRRIAEQRAQIPNYNNTARFDPGLEHYVVNDTRGLIVIRRTDTNQEVARLRSPVKSDCRGQFSPDGKWLAARTESLNPGALSVWEWRTGRLVFQTSDEVPVFGYSLSFSADSRLLAVGMPAHVSIIDLMSGQEVNTLPIAMSGFRSIAIAPDGARIALGSRGSHQVRICDLRDGKVLKSLENGIPTFDLAWHPDGELLAVSGFGDQHIHLWNASTGSKQAVLHGHQSEAWSLQFSPVDDLLVSTSWDRTVRVWNVSSGREIFRLPGTFCAWSRDGQRLAVLCDQKAQVWQRVAGACNVLPGSLTGFTNFGGRLSPDGRWLAMRHANGLRLIGLSSAKMLPPIPINAVAVHFLPEGNEFLTSGPDGLQRWPFGTDQTTVRIGPPRTLAAISGAMSMDGRGRSLLVFVHNATKPALFDLSKPDAAPRLLDHTPVGSAAVSPDGRWVITGSHNGYGVRIFDTTSGQLACPPLLPHDRHTLVGFRPDSREFVTSTRDGPDLVTIWWEVGSWKELRRIPQEGPFAWSPDSQLFAQTDDSYRVRLRTGDGASELAVLEAPDDAQIRSLAFLPESGRLLVDAGHPLTIRVWDLREIRAELDSLGLDWNAPPYPPAKATDVRPQPLTLELQLAVPAEQGAQDPEEQK